MTFIKINKFKVVNIFRNSLLKRMLIEKMKSMTDAYGV